MPSPLDPIVQRTRARVNFGALSGALELLESPLVSTRMGGIYALEALAREEAGARKVVGEVLCALVRRRAGAARTQTGAVSEARVASDVQAALAVLGRLAREGAGAPLDLHGISLREAFLPAAQLAGALLYESDLEGALLQDADLRNAWLWRANLKRANLDNADLRGADLSGARGLTSAQIAAALSDEHTRWPDLDEAQAPRGARWTPR